MITCHDITWFHVSSLHFTSFCYINLLIPILNIFIFICFTTIVPLLSFSYLSIIDILLVYFSPHFFFKTIDNLNVNIFLSVTYNNEL